MAIKVEAEANCGKICFKMSSADGVRGSKHPRHSVAEAPGDVRNFGYKT